MGATTLDHPEYTKLSIAHTGTFRRSKKERRYMKLHPEVSEQQLRWIFR